MWTEKKSRGVVRRSLYRLRKVEGVTFLRSFTYHKYGDKRQAFVHAICRSTDRADVESLLKDAGFRASQISTVKQRNGYYNILASTTKFIVGS